MQILEFIHSKPFYLSLFWFVQKRVNTANLKHYLLKSLLTTLALNWHLGTWMGSFPPNWKEWLTVSPLFVQTIWFILYTCFPSGSLEDGMCQAKGIYQPPMKPRVLSLSWASLVGNISHVLSQLVAGKRPLEACALLSLDFNSCTFSFCWFCFMSFSCNKSQLWIWLYPESYESS